MEGLGFMGDEEEEELLQFRKLEAPLIAVRDAAEEVLLLWCRQQPVAARHNAFVRQEAPSFRISAAGHDLLIHQAPSSMQKPGVTGAVVWDSGVVLAKFLEQAVDDGILQLQGKKCVELGAGCGLAGCVAALLGAEVILTDLPDRLRLLQKNVHENFSSSGTRKGSASVRELSWGDELDEELLNPPSDYVIASDVVYNEEAVQDLLHTLEHLCSTNTLAIISGELRNDSVLEYFLQQALERFSIGRLPAKFWNPAYLSQRVAIFVLTSRSTKSTETRGF